MADDRYALLYDESKRQLDAHLRDLDQLRSRAATVISAAAVSTSFLGGGLIRVKSIETLGWIAIGLFVVAVVLALWALGGPMRNVPAGFSPAAVEASWVRGRNLPADAIRRQLALDIEAAVAESDAKLDRRRWALALASVALAAEVVVWVVELA